MWHSPHTENAGTRRDLEFRMALDRLKQVQPYHTGTSYEDHLRAMGGEGVRHYARLHAHALLLSGKTRVEIAYQYGVSRECMREVLRTLGTKSTDELMQMLG